MPQASGTTPKTFVRHALDLGLDEGVISELAEIMDWDDVGAGTESDAAILHVLANALALGMPRDALIQMVHVFADATDRLADAITRTFHNYVHERFRAQGLTGPELLAASEDVGKPLLDLIEPTIVYISTGGRISAPTAKTCSAILPSRLLRCRERLARNTRQYSLSIWPALPR